MQQLDNGPSRSLNSKSKYFAPGRIKPLPVLDEERELGDLSLDGAGEPHASGSSEPRPRKRNVSEVSGLSGSSSKKKKASRPYAPPETYARLTWLPDYLKDNLDGKLESHSRDLIFINIPRSCFLWY